jgi:glycosyltransferase involved in cell wall biosynthesis
MHAVTPSDCAPPSNGHSVANKLPHHVPPTRDLTLRYVANVRLPTEKANGYQVLQTCQAFTEIGQPVELLYPKRVNTPELRKITDLDAFYGLRVPFPRTEVACRDWLHFVTNTFPLLRGLAPAAFRHQLRTFAKYAAAALGCPQQQVVYTRSPEIFEYFLRDAPSHTRPLPWFLELHQVPSDSRRLRRQLVMLHRIAGVISLTQAMADSLRAQGVPEEHILVEPDAVDWETFRSAPSKSAARRAHAIDEHVQVAMYVGKFHTMGSEKGIPDIIASAAELIPKHPGLVWYFVGGPLDRVSKYEQQIERLGLPRERFVFLDKQPVAELPYYLATADVLLMPFPNTHHYAHCMSPLKMFEYMTADRPIVASRLPSIGEVLQHEHNALLCEPDDPRDLAKTIDRCLADERLATRIASQAKKDVQQYTWRRRAERIRDFMQQRLARQRSQAPEAAR